MKTNILSITLLFSVLFLSCNKPKKENVSKKEKESVSKKEILTFKNKGHELVYKMVQKVGDIDKLKSKKDVVYTYTYQTPDGKADVSTEKYIFNGEFSYGKYNKHERTFPDLEGEIEQGYNGKEFWLKHKGAVIEDENRLKRVMFNRPTNFYWFAMLPKLLDPGLNYEVVENKEITSHDIVKVSFKSQGEKPTDIYQVYINKETLLVDYFLFTVADFGVMETPLLMQVEYEEIDGLLIPTKRKYKKSTWEATVDETPWIHVNWTDIKFNNNLIEENFKK